MLYIRENIFQGKIEIYLRWQTTLNTNFLLTVLWFKKDNCSRQFLSDHCLNESNIKNRYTFRVCVNAVVYPCVHTMAVIRVLQRNNTENDNGILMAALSSES